MNIKYSIIPKEYDLTHEFDTYIIAFCPDEDMWFITRQRFFFFEYKKEFMSYEEAEKYFIENLLEFFNLRDSMKEAIPFYSLSKDVMYFENKFIYRNGEIK